MLKLNGFANKILSMSNFNQTSVGFNALMTSLSHEDSVCSVSTSHASENASSQLVTSHNAELEIAELKSQVDSETLVPPLGIES